jgi:pyruvate/2-oxoacid:ferredoxin oxidoreductase beta subunit/Pyruvate/2-oxoacid:ferredoxin oxidoreductase gamma subunit
MTPLGSYRTEAPYPFCPGCGHGPILDHLNRGLQLCGLDPRKVVLVSDIGCSGLSDQYFATNAFHGLHGRSITYASGIKFANPDLTVVVIMGDGGTGIGGTHIISAARRNVGITVLVFNNFNFGMTGGQHSAMTPAGGLTSTTPGGSLELPLDICATVAANGASYVYRGTSFDPDLPQRIADSIRCDGFGLLDIWELCTAYYVPRNALSRRALAQSMLGPGLESGLLVQRTRPEYSRAWRQAHAACRGEPVLSHQGLDARFSAGVATPVRIVVAGSAGGRVRSAARIVARAAVLSGLWAAQRDDYPITVKSGHSVAELVLSPVEIQDAGIQRPDVLLILSEDGQRKVTRYLSRMGPLDHVFVLSPLKPPDCRAPVTRLDPDALSSRIPRGGLALAAFAAAVQRLGLLPWSALEAAVRASGPSDTAEALRALGAGEALAATAQPGLG